MIGIGQRVPAALAAAEVVDVNSQTRALATTWNNRDVVVVCVRHFACIGCAEQLDVLRPRLGELERLRVDVVIIGSGTPEQLATFVEREQLARPHPRRPASTRRHALRARGRRGGVLSPRAQSRRSRARR